MVRFPLLTITMAYTFFFLYKNEGSAFSTIAERASVYYCTQISYCTHTNNFNSYSILFMVAYKHTIIVWIAQLRSASLLRALDFIKCIWCVCTLYTSIRYLHKQRVPPLFFQFINAPFEFPKIEVSFYSLHSHFLFKSIAY